MISREQLLQQLDGPDFYNKVYPVFFHKGKRKEALETWMSAAKKGVADAVLIRQAFNNSFT